MEANRNPEIVKKIGPASLLYAIFFTFCLYKNGSGITYPFYTAGTVLFCIYIIRKSGISWKKEHSFVLAAEILLGISTCMTDSDILILMNKCWLFVLTLYFLLASVFQTRDWQLGKFLTAMLKLVVGSIGRQFTFFLDMREVLEERDKKIFNVIIGICCSVPLLAIVIMLLSSADLVFEKNMNMLLYNIKFNDIFRCVFWIAAVFLFSYGMAVMLFKKEIKETVKDYRVGQPVIAVSATAVVAAVYVYFCAIQVIYLFTGNGTLPDGYTYAQYARQGFFQLLFVCLLNLALVLAGLEFFRESRALEGILLTISFCTVIMTASSFYRMLLYISAYYLTFLRIYVLWALCVIALLMAGVISKILKRGFSLFRYGLAVITCCYLILSFSHPDYWIARYNTGYMTFAEGGGIEEAYLYDENGENMHISYMDLGYLNRLSADAAPAILTEKNLQLFTENIKTETPDRCWFRYYIMKHKEKVQGMSWRSYNFSRGYIKRALKS